MPFAQRMVLTEVAESPEGDTWFPEWDHSQWQEVTREQHAGFEIATYERA